MIDSELTETQRLIRDTAKEFARDELAPGAAEHDRNASFPKASIEAMGKLGFFGMLVPEQWGGAEVDQLSYAMALEEIAVGDGAVSTIMSVHNSFCLTEPGAGSDASALSCKAVENSEGYVLNGVKQFITSGSTAGLAIVFARTDEGKRGISAFLVPTDNPGYNVSRVEAKLGQRASDTCQIALTDCQVPHDALLGEPGQGYSIALSNLEGGRIGIAAQSVGMARAAYEHSLEFSTQRQAFGKPIFEHQAIAFKLADMATQIDAARLMVHRAAKLRDAGEPCLTEASMAKLFASEMAERVCSEAIQIHGGYGYLNEYPVERIARDVRVCQLYEGTSEVQRMVISRSLNTA